MTDVRKSFSHFGLGGLLIRDGAGAVIAKSAVIVDLVWVSWQAVACLVCEAASWVSCDVFWEARPLFLRLVWVQASSVGGGSVAGGSVVVSGSRTSTSILRAGEGMEIQGASRALRGTARETA